MNEHIFNSKMDEINYEMSLESRKGDFNRVRSLNVGTTFNGGFELSVRSNDGKSYWVPLNVDDVIQLINQLALIIRCQVELKQKEILINESKNKNTKEQK